MKNKLFVVPEIQSIDEFLAIAQEFGTGFELNDFFRPELLENESAIAERIEFYKKKMPSAGCTIHGAFFDIMIFSLDPGIRRLSRERIWSGMRTASELSAQAIIFHTNYISTVRIREYIQAWIDINDSFWREVCDEFKDVTVYIENSYDPTPFPLNELMDGLSDVQNMGICLDYTHASLSDAPIEQWVETLKDKVSHVHLNDHDGKADMHMPVGSGVTDWVKCTELMRRLGDVSVLIEVMGINETRQSLEYMKKHRVFPFD